MQATSQVPQASVPTLTNVQYSVLNTRYWSRANQNYYKALEQKVSRNDKVLKILLAIATPSTLAGAIGSTTIPSDSELLQIATVLLALFATAVGAVNLKLDYTDRIKKIASLYHTFVSLEIRAGHLWNKLDAGQSVSFAEAERLQVEFSNTKQEELEIPDDRELMRQAAADAQRTLELHPFPPF